MTDDDLHGLVTGIISGSGEAYKRLHNLFRVNTTTTTVSYCIGTEYNNISDKRKAVLAKLMGLPDTPTQSQIIEGCLYYIIYMYTLIHTNEHKILTFYKIHTSHHITPPHILPSLR
jgi:hypothetical protein